MTLYAPGQLSGSWLTLALQIWGGLILVFVAAAAHFGRRAYQPLAWGGC